jgi:hypothetical protein
MCAASLAEVTLEDGFSLHEAALLLRCQQLPRLRKVELQGMGKPKGLLVGLAAMGSSEEAEAEEQQQQQEVERYLPAAGSAEGRAGMCDGWYFSLEHYVAELLQLRQAE